MPEGPDIHLASKFINQVCSKRIFGGKIVRSEVNKKNCEIPWTQPCYTILATSRGKELKLILTAVSNGNSKTKLSASLGILFRFGMTGKFCFHQAESLPKHSHLRFYTKDEKDVLSFVDSRRFGRWEVINEWGKERSPCVIQEYASFRKHVLSLDEPAFRKPICEVMLNQKYFNGIGNYLRAEILYRAGVPPFESAAAALKDLGEKEDSDTKSDLLSLCHIVSMEAVQLGGGAGYGVSTDYASFEKWLRCYEKKTMKKLTDHNGRTIWFTGSPGPLVPKGEKGKRKSRPVKAAIKRKTEESAGTAIIPESLKKVKKEEVEPVIAGGQRKPRKRLQQSPRATKNPRKTVKDNTKLNKTIKLTRTRLKTRKSVNPE